jgi:IS5 family transposase
MKPHDRTAQTAEMFRPRLDELLNMKHPLIRLAGLMDWELIEHHFAGHFTSGRGRPALPPRLVAGLLYLQHANDASDEMVVNTWLENPYWQFFTGETYLQTELPIDPSSLTRWRQRIGEEGVELLLAVTIEAARAAGLIKRGDRGHHGHAQGDCPSHGQPLAGAQPPAHGQVRSGPWHQPAPELQP